MTVKNDNQPSNAQISAYRALWQRLLGCGGQKMSQQRQSSEKTDLNVADGDAQQSHAQKQGINDED